MSKFSDVEIKHQTQPRKPRTHGRAPVRFNFYLPAGHAGAGHRQVIATIEHTATEKGGKIESVNKWGRKRMAYRVQKLREGYYVYMVLKSRHGEVIKELERRLKVFRRGDEYLTVRVDEELKRQEKLKRHRERPQHAAAQTAPVPAATPTPASVPPAGGETPAAAV